jgi:hypothetical protein
MDLKQTPANQTPVSEPKSTFEKATNSFSKFKKVTTDDVAVAKRTSSKGGSGGYSLSIVCTEDNSNNLGFSQGLYDALDLGTSNAIQILTNEKFLYVSAKFSDDNETFNFPSGSNKRRLYNAGLVKFIVKEFELEYAKGGTTSRTFNKVEVLTEANDNGDKIIFAKIKMAN